MKVQTRSRLRSNFTRFSLFTLGILVVLTASNIAVSAQSLSARPVARLITGTTSDPKAEPATPALTSPSIGEATEAERRAFDATNEVRLKDGLEPLKWDPQLCLLARQHSRNMAVLNFFSHQTPEGFRLRDRARQAGIRYEVIAENIAYNQGVEDPGTFAVERWMLSPGHRANLLSPEFRAGAVGSFTASDGRVFLTQLFILR